MSAPESSTNPNWSWPKRSDSGDGSPAAPGTDLEVADAADVAVEAAGIRGAVSALVPAAIGVLVAFGVELTDAQQNAIITASGALTVLGVTLLARRRRRSR